MTASWTFIKYRPKKFKMDVGRRPSNMQDRHFAVGRMISCRNGGTSEGAEIGRTLSIHCEREIIAAKCVGEISDLGILVTSWDWLWHWLWH